MEKKLQLIQTIWDVMALLSALHFPSETTCSCKQDTKERYWGQQFWQVERDISVWVTEMTRPVDCGPPSKLRSRIFRSDQTEMVRSIYEPTEISGILAWMESACGIRICNFNFESTLIQSQWKLFHVLWIWNQVDAKIYTNIFLSSDATRLSPVLYCEYCIQDGNLVPRFSLFSPSRPG